MFSFLVFISIGFVVMFHIHIHTQTEHSFTHCFIFLQKRRKSTPPSIRLHSWRCRPIANQFRIRSATNTAQRISYEYDPANGRYHCVGKSQRFRSVRISSERKRCDSGQCRIQSEHLFGRRS